MPVNLSTFIRRHAAAIWSNRWPGLAATWLICLVGWGAVAWLPNQYQASARVFADADAVLGTLLRGLALDSSPAGEVDTLQRTLLSRPNLEIVANATDLARRLPHVVGREALLDRLQRDIRLTNQTRNLFTLTYRSTDPQLAHDVVQALLQVFIEAATGTDRRQFEAARDFLQDQIVFYEGRLREAERRRAEFQSRYIDLLPSAALGGVSRLESGRAALAQLRGELTDARMRRDLTQQQLAASPALLPPEPGDGSTAGRLAEAERVLRELRLRYTEQHPAVATARAQVAELRASGAGLPGRAQPRSNPLHEQLRGRLVDADVMLASLERRVREGEAEVDRLEAVARTEPELLAQFTNLDRDYNVLRRHYEELLARRESIRIADAARTDSDRVKLEVVDPPVVPAMPSGPNRMLFSAGVLLMGLGGGGALAFLLAQFAGVFYTVQDLRGIGLPVIGALSAVNRPTASRVAAAAAFSLASVLLLATFAAVVLGRERLLDLMT